MYHLKQIEDSTAKPQRRLAMRGSAGGERENGHEAGLIWSLWFHVCVNIRARSPIKLGDGRRSLGSADCERGWEAPTPYRNGHWSAWWMRSARKGMRWSGWRRPGT